MTLSYNRTVTSTRRAALAGGLLGLALAAGFLAPCLLGRRVPARGDLPDFFWPMKAHTAARWRAGAIPLWNPLSGCGEPWLGQLQTGVLYPGDLPFFLAFPFGAIAGIALHVVIAASGMSAWLADLGSSRRGALAAAAVYAGGGAFVSLFVVYNNACTAAWLPCVFLGARRLLSGEGIAGFSFAAAMAFLAGEPALAVAGAAAALFAAAFSRAEGEPAAVKASRVGGPVLLGILLAGGLAAVSAGPFFELIGTTGRRALTSEAEALERPVSSGDVLDLAFPVRPETTATGSPDRGGYVQSLALGPLALVLAAGAAAGFPGRRRLLLALAIVGGAGFLMSLGSAGLLAPALYRLGVLRGVRFPARWIVFPHLVLAFAAGAGLDGWLFGRFRKPQRAAGAEGAVPAEDEVDPRSVSAARWTRLVGLAVASGLVLAAAIDAKRGGRDPARLLPPAAAVLLGALLLFLARRFQRPAPAAAAAGIVVLLFVPLVLIARDPLESVPAAPLAAPPRVVSGLEAGTRRIFPAVADSQILSRVTMPYGWSAGTPLLAHAALAGYGNLGLGLPSAASGSPIGNPRLSRLLGAALAGGSAATILGLADIGTVIVDHPTRIPGARLVRWTEGVYRIDLPKGAGRLFFARDARVLDDDAVFAAMRVPGFDPEAVVFLAEPPGLAVPRPSPRSFSVARFEKDLPERAEVVTNCSEACLLTFTRCFDPGWKATVDAAPAKVVRADLAFLALAVPAGEHHVVLSYQPTRFRLWAIVSGASLLVLVGLVLAGRRPVSR